MFNLLDKKIIIYDTETEGLNHMFTRPWELAFCVYEKNKKVYEYQSYLKWPNLKVSFGAAKQTGYNAKEVQDKGREPKEVMDHFRKYLYDDEYYIVGHNILRYDSQIINTANRELGYDTDFSFTKRCIDTNALARALKLNRLKKEHEDIIAWQYRILDIRAKGVKTRIQVLCDEFKITYDKENLHGALYDVEMNYEILKRLVQKMDISL